MMKMMIFCCVAFLLGIFGADAKHGAESGNDVELFLRGDPTRQLDTVNDVEEEEDNPTLMIRNEQQQEQQDTKDGQQDKKQRLRDLKKKRKKTKTSSPSTTLAPSTVNPPSSSTATKSPTKRVTRGDSFCAKREEDDDTLALDQDYGKLGLASAPIHSIDDSAKATTVQQYDGKVLVCGVTKVGFSYDFMVLRLTLSGEFDKSFGTNGIAEFASLRSSWCNSVVVDETSRKIYAAGYASVEGGAARMVVVRLDEKGELDKSFGPNGNGISILNQFPGATDEDGDDQADTVLLSRGGGITLVGYSLRNTEGDYDFAFARIDPSTGQLDKTVGTNQSGARAASFSKRGKDKAYAAAMFSFDDDMQEKIIAVGSGWNSDKNKYDFAVCVVKEGDLSMDNTFGTKGEVMMSVGNYFDSASAVVADPTTNTFIIGGQSEEQNPAGPYQYYQFALLKIDQFGKRVQSFGTNNGIAKISLSDGKASCFLTSMLLLDQNSNAKRQLIVGGTAFGDSPGKKIAIGLVLVNPETGNVDDTKAKSQEEIALDTGNSKLSAMAVNPNDGSIYVVGTQTKDKDYKTIIGTAKLCPI